MRSCDDIFIDELADNERKLINLARLALDDGNLVTARSILMPLVDGGNSAAIYYESLFGRDKESIDDFENRHVSQIRFASDLGFVPATFRLAVYLDAGDMLPQDKRMAAELFKKASDRKHPHAMWIHGIDLLLGRNGFCKDESVGIDLIKESATMDFQGALESLSEFYAKGSFGFPVNELKSKEMLSRSCDKNVIGYCS